MNVEHFILFRTAQFNALAHICDYLRANIEFKNDFTNESIYNIMEDLAPNVEYMFDECSWQQKKVNCSEYISTEFNYEGLCFTFNALDSYDRYTEE